MKKGQVYNEIAILIAREVLDVITPAERSELNRWLEENDSHREIYGRIKAHIETLPEKSYRTDAQIMRAWEKFAGNAAGKRRGKTVRLALRYAAVLVVALGCGWLLVERLQTKNEPGKITVIPASHDEARLVALTHPDGGKVYFDPRAEDWAEAQAMIDEAGKDGRNIQDARGEDIYATITVPRGSTFKTVVLGDVKVFFNSESELRYQLNVTDNHRKFHVKGEVFFDIDKPLATPIHVYPAEDICIRVLGTSFNVKSYGDEPEVTTTLVTGKLEIRGLNMTTILEPSEQLVYNRAEESLFKQKVDTRSFTAWTEGKFLFQNETLGQILRRISRWYDVEIAWSDESLLDNRFTGDLEWYDELETALSMLEKVTGIRIGVGKPRATMDKI